MADWLSSMQQTYEYYIVDPGTWKDMKQITAAKSASINRDSSLETLGSATIDVTDSLGECYIRVYLITIQNGIREKHPLGTFLVQTPSSTFDGKTRDVTMDAYTPLLELKEKLPPFGYYIPKGKNIMDYAYDLTNDNVRAPVVKPVCSELLTGDFVAEPNETYLSFNTYLMANAKYQYDIDEMGRILFAPKQDTASLQPIWTFDDSNSSILYFNVTMEHDLYNVPNVVEVIYSNSNGHYHITVVNDDENSPTSIQSRGRRIVRRFTDPELTGNPTESQVRVYAEQLLRDLSTVEYTISFEHAYCPVRVGDCVRLNYTRAGLTDIKAKIISQSIKCEPGCPVSAKAVFPNKLWR